MKDEGTRKRDLLLHRRKLHEDWLAHTDTFTHLVSSNFFYFFSFHAPLFTETTSTIHSPFQPIDVNYCISKRGPIDSLFTPHHVIVMYKPSVRPKAPPPAPGGQILCNFTVFKPMFCPLKRLSLTPLTLALNLTSPPNLSPQPNWLPLPPLSWSRIKFSLI